MIQRNILVALAVVVLASCSTDVEVENAPAQVVAVGPVWLDGDVLVVEVATWDHEGDPLALLANVVDAGGTRTPLSTAALAPYQLQSLPTERARETRQLFEWQFGLDDVGASDEVSLEISSGELGTPTVVFGPFVPAALAPAAPLPPPAPAP